MRHVFAVLVFLTMARVALADGTIDTLSAGTALGGTESIPMFQTANPAVKTTPAAIATYISGSANAWSAFQTYTNSMWGMKGSSTGVTTLTSDNAGASNFTVHLPAANDTIALLAATQTLTNKTISGSSNTLSNIANASLTNPSTTVNGQTCTLGSTCTVGAAFSAITSGTNTTAALHVGSGATLDATGSGAITATAVPLSGVTGMGAGVGTAAADPVNTSGGLLTSGAADGQTIVFTASNKLSTAITDTVHAASATTANLGGEDDYNGSSITATLATLAAGQTLVITDQNASALTVALGGQTVVGLPLATTLHTGGFYGFTFNSLGTLSGFGFPGFGTITTGALTKFVDGSGAATASGLTESGGILSTADGLTLTGLSSGTVVSGKYLGLDSSNHVVLGSGGSGGSGVTFTDGVNTVTGATQLTVTGGIVGGTTPNATLTVTGGGSGALTLISTLTANNTAATLAWAGLTGNEYTLRCANLIAGNTTNNLVVQIGEGATPTWKATGYNQQGAIQSSTGSPAAANFTNVAGLWNFATASSGTIGMSASVDFHALSSSTAAKTFTSAIFLEQDSGTDYWINVSGRYTTDTATVTAIRVIDTDTHNLVTGYCSLYAVAN